MSIVVAVVGICPIGKSATKQEHGLGTLGAPCSVLRSLSLVSPRPSLSDNRTLCHRHSQMTRHSVLPFLPPPAFVSRRSISSWEYRKKDPMLSVSSFHLFHTLHVSLDPFSYIGSIDSMIFRFLKHTRADAVVFAISNLMRFLCPQGTPPASFWASLRKASGWHAPEFEPPSTRIQ